MTQPRGERGPGAGRRGCPNNHPPPVLGSPPRMRARGPLRWERAPSYASGMHGTDDANDALRLAILAVLATREMPMTAEEIADEIARLALEGQQIALSSGRDRGHQEGRLARGHPTTWWFRPSGVLGRVSRDHGPAILNGGVRPKERMSSVVPGTPANCATSW